MHPHAPLSSVPLRPRRGPVRAAFVYGVVAGGLFVGSVVSGCRRPPTANVDVASPPVATSADCRSCHEDIFKAWSLSHHAKAHRPIQAAADAPAFTAVKELSLHGVDYQFAWQEGRPIITERRGTQAPETYTADFVLGYTPLRQYIVPIGGGRYQAAELSFDPAKKEWFNVFGGEQRQRGEWGDWRGRGMNWNSMCAHCHLTDFRKNYDAGTDTYASTWREHGVGCAQCHGDMEPSHGKVIKPSRPAEPVAPTAVERQRAMETCAPCHARNELLTGEVRPGVPYADHYRLTLPTEAATFYPDGQMRDEDFNYTSMLLSRMGGKAGVTCLDCHDPHSARTRLPVENNALCLQCHATPGRQNAPVIDPTAHSHHGADSKGNRCVECHMPTTTFMQRDPRHDHGFLRPDPLLTKELGIPNACARCHADQSVDWAIAATDGWYGAKMDSRQRARARVVTAAQAGAPDGAAKLVSLLATEDIPAWKATLLLLARPYAATNAPVAGVARAALTDPDAHVRSAAVQALTTRPNEQAALTPLLKDPELLVRVDAEWALSADLPDNSPGRKELDAYLAVSADQPMGRLRIAQDLFNRGRAAEALPPLRLATEWDPNSGGLFEALGTVLNATNQSAEAAAAFWRAAQLAPADADAAFSAALAFAGAGKLPDAEVALRECLRRNPRHDRAWYNLGLLLAQTNRGPEAMGALQNAERIAPRSADYPYAIATLLLQSGDRAGAIAAAQRALAIDPAHAQAREFLRQAGG